MPELVTFDYDRELAVAYANEWAYSRNPEYYDFHGIGGDCTNFVSQCLYAGSGVMNFTPVYGWYYLSANDRTASWTGVPYLYDFLTANEGTGPFARVVPIAQVQPGDVVQMRINQPVFHHSALIVRVGDTPTYNNVLVASHTRDVNNRPVSTYDFRQIRFLHIEGVRSYAD